MVVIKGNRGGFNERDVVKEVVSEDDLHGKTLNRSDWVKFANGTEKDTEK